MVSSPESPQPPPPPPPPAMAETDEHPGSPLRNTAVEVSNPEATLGTPPITAQAQTNAMAQPVVFKKRRKVTHHLYRRVDADDEDLTSLKSSDGEPGTSAIRRVIKPKGKPKACMVVSSRPMEQSIMTVAPAPQEKSVAEQYAGRFVKPTGQFVDADDKLLNEYIETGMAEWRRNPNAPLVHPWDRARLNPSQSSGSAASYPAALQLSDSLGPTSHSLSDKPAHASAFAQNDRRDMTADNRQAASAGKLVEVDLGPQAALENIRRTEAALRKMMGGFSEEENTGKGRKRGRGGRNVKPRTSVDEERDRKVEEFMKQAPVYHFDLEQPAPESDRPTDEVVAEQFQKEFMESLENNRIMRKPPVPTGRKDPTEPAKGPKLGGSRSARAMMKAKEEENNNKR